MDHLVDIIPTRFKTADPGEPPESPTLRYRRAFKQLMDGLPNSKAYGAVLLNPDFEPYLISGDGDSPHRDLRPEITAGSPSGGEGSDHESGSHGVVALSSLAESRPDVHSSPPSSPSQGDPTDEQTSATSSFIQLNDDKNGSVSSNRQSGGSSEPVGLASAKPAREASSWTPQTLYLHLGHTVQVQVRTRPEIETNRLEDG